MALPLSSDISVGMGSHGTPLSLNGLVGFERELRSSQVLSIYIEVEGDSVPRRAWRSRLREELRRIERSHVHAPPEERAALQTCCEAVVEELLPYPRNVSVPSLVAVASSAGARHSARLAVPLATEAFWGRGMRIAPYVRGMPVQRPTVVLATTMRQAVIYEYSAGVLKSVMSAPLPSSRRPTQRLRECEPSSMPSALVPELAAAIGALAVDDAWILSLGVSWFADAVLEELPVALASRASRDRIDVGHLTTARLLDAVRQRVADLESKRQRAAVDRLVARDAPAGRAIVGVAAVQGALAGDAIAQLIFSPRLAQDVPETLEGALRVAFDQGAAIEAVDGIAARRLDEIGGIAASLASPNSPGDGCRRRRLLGAWIGAAAPLALVRQDAALAATDAHASTTVGETPGR